MKNYTYNRQIIRKIDIKKSAQKNIRIVVLRNCFLFYGLILCSNPTDGVIRNKDLVHHASTGEKDSVSCFLGYKATFNSPPTKVPSRKVVDGPPIGNGDVGVVLSGTPDKPRFWISKNDFRKTKPVYPNAGPRPIGCIEIDIPALEGGSYHVGQLLENGTIVARFTTTKFQRDPGPNTREGTTIEIRSWTAAKTNLLIIELSVEGEHGTGDLMSRIFPGKTSAVGVDARLTVKTGDESVVSGGNMADGYWIKREFNTPEASVSIEQKPLVWNSEAVVAMRLLNHRQLPLPWSRGDGWSGDRFIIAPGLPVTIVESIVTNEEMIINNLNSYFALIN